jgi:hypothetical protein
LTGQLGVLDVRPHDAIVTHESVSPPFSRETCQRLWQRLHKKYRVIDVRSVTVAPLAAHRGQASPTMRIFSMLSIHGDGRR